MGAKFNTLRTICRQAVDTGVTPSLVVTVGQAGSNVFHEAFGAASVETTYDLASLTKAAVTSLLAMRGVAAGQLELDDPLAMHAPDWAGTGKEGVTLRQVLAHASGLPAHRRLFETANGRTQIVSLAAREPLAYAPGTRSLYSDLGFILLGDVLERRMGARLDVLAERDLFRPLGLTSLRFNPGAGGAIAPTEMCPVRGRLIAGEVHDLNAFAMEGVAGHAGLFGTAAELSTLAAALCTAWQGGTSSAGSTWLHRDVLREFWTPAGIPASTWRLGWDGPAAADSAAGRLLARRAVGHLGFTGCSLWIDPERETYVVMLSNRVHPSAADNPRFRALRPAVHDAALEGAGYVA